MMWKSQILRVPTIVSPLETAVTPSIICTKVQLVGMVASWCACSRARLTYLARSLRHPEDRMLMVQAIIEAVAVVLVLKRMLLECGSLVFCW